MLKFDDKKILNAWKDILEGLKIDTNDPNFKDTPKRILKSYYEMLGGMDYDNEIKEILTKTFPTKYKGMVIEGPIKCVSICPHHLLPVKYIAYIGIIYGKGCLGLSKLARVIELIAKAPKLQEDTTKEIINVLNNYLHPKGIIVVLKGSHSCMQERGVKQDECDTITSEFIGCFIKKEPRDEFLSLIKLK